MFSGRGSETPPNATEYPSSDFTHFARRTKFMEGLPMRNATYSFAG